MAQPFDIATQIIFDTCASSVNLEDGTVLIVASTPGLGEPLLERLQLTPGIHGILLPHGTDVIRIASEMDCSSGFSLVWIQPLNADLDFIFSLLHHPALRLVILLEASWLGRQVLPLWNTLPRSSLAIASQMHRLLQSELGRFQQEYSSGNIFSLWWGFLANRIQGLGRPDLADRCFAHMRCHLSPSFTYTRPAYLTLSLVSREDSNITTPENASDLLQV